MKAYYNEVDKNAAEWLRELIRGGLIADGEVDERSIVDVAPEDLHGFTQCHFFAGIGVWSYALRLAGWSDDRPVWTGSCPCQPFSSAGEQRGLDDERHLWPTWNGLIRACAPPVIYGEQVASAAAIGKVGRKPGSSVASTDEWAWLDHVQNDLEASHYAVGVVVAPGCSVGAPHIRQRLYFVAKSTRQQQQWGGPLGTGRKPEHTDSGAAGRVDHTAGARPFPTGVGTEAEARDEARLRGPERGRGVGSLGDTQRTGLEGHGRNVLDGIGSRRVEADTRGPVAPPSLPLGGMADDGRIEPREGRVPGSQGGKGSQQRSGPGPRVPLERMGHDTGTGLEVAVQHTGRGPASAGQGQTDDAGRAGILAGTSPTDGWWRDCDWLWCRDERWRPIEPGAVAVVDGSSDSMGPSGDPSAQDCHATSEGRVTRLKGYGNAIIAQQAAAFIAAGMEALDDV